MVIAEIIAPTLVFIIYAGNPIYILNSFLNNVIVLPGVTIGEGVVIQAGSVVVKDIPALSVAGGHPAKVFKTRDIEHYNELKNQKLFF